MSAIIRFGEYEVRNGEDGSPLELGRGAMGITYKAFDARLKRPAALKVIHPAAIQNSNAKERFMREAQMAAQLKHPNIATVYQLGETPDGIHYIAMEFCDGRTVEQTVREEGPLGWRRALGIASDVAAALSAAAKRSLIHRDIKPSNLMLVTEDDTEVLKVIDFGLAKMTGPDGAGWPTMGTQGFIGTPYFASPEQIRDDSVDTRSDIYALGATLWFMLVGKAPFKGSLEGVVTQHLTADPDFSELRGAPSAVAALLRRMLAKRPEDRQQTAPELLAEIRKCLEEEGRRDFETAPETRTARNEGMPTLADLLAQRRELPLEEALAIGKVLADTLDAEAPSEPPPRALSLDDVGIRFRDRPAGNEATARLREPVTAWRDFDLVLTNRDSSSGGMAPAGAQPPDERGSDRVRQLAGALYEMLSGGGNFCGTRILRPGRETSRVRDYEALTILSEKTNALLERGMADGTAAFPRAIDLIHALHEAIDTPARATSSGPSPAARTTARSGGASGGAGKAASPLAIGAGVAALSLFCVFGWKTVFREKPANPPSHSRDARPDSRSTPAASPSPAAETPGPTAAPSGRNTPPRSIPVELKTDKTTYKEGEEPIVTVRAAESGHLRIFYQNAVGEITTLFPNQYIDDDRIEGGRPLRVMPAQNPKKAGEEVAIHIAGPSFGTEYLAAVVTDQPFADDAALKEELRHWQVLGLDASSIEGAITKNARIFTHAANQDRGGGARTGFARVTLTTIAK